MPCHAMPCHADLFYFYGQKDLTLPASAPAVAHSPATPVRAGSRASRSAPPTQEQPQTSAEPATAAATAAAAAAAGGSESGTGGAVRVPPPSTPGQAPSTRAGRKKRNSPASAAPLDPPASRLPEGLGGDAPGGVEPEAGQSHGLGPSSRQEAGLRGEGEGGGGVVGGAGTGGDVVVMRVHFGMSGAFRVHALPGPEPTPTTRLELSHRQVWRLRGKGGGGRGQGRGQGRGRGRGWDRGPDAGPGGGPRRR
ncbi:hypothetical protein V8C86DRAFT_1391226 [Haematococcus lacustris]